MVYAHFGVFSVISVLIWNLEEDREDGIDYQEERKKKEKSRLRLTGEKAGSLVQEAISLSSLPQIQLRRRERENPE